MSVFHDEILQEIDNPDSAYPYVHGIARKLHALYGGGEDMWRLAKNKTATKLSCHEGFFNLKSMISRVAESLEGSDLSRWSEAEWEVARYIKSNETCYYHIISMGAGNKCEACMPDPLNRKCEHYKPDTSGILYYIPG